MGIDHMHSPTKAAERCHRLAPLGPGRCVWLAFHAIMSLFMTLTQKFLSSTVQGLDIFHYEIHIHRKSIQMLSV